MLNANFTTSSWWGQAPVVVCRRSPLLTPLQCLLWALGTSLSLTFTVENNAVAKCECGYQTHTCEHSHTSAPLNLLWLSPALVLSLMQYFFTFFLGMLGSQEDKSKDSSFIGAWRYKEKPNSVFLCRRSSFTGLFLSLLNNLILAKSNTKQQVTTQLPVCTVVCIIYEATCAVCIQNQISLLVLQHCSVNPPATLSPTPLPVSAMRVWVDL